MSRSLKDISDSLEKKRPTAVSGIQRKEFAENWIKQPGLDKVLRELAGPSLPWGTIVKPMVPVDSKPNEPPPSMNHEFAAKLKPFFKKEVPPKFATYGAGFHGGYGAGMTGFEGGSIWTTPDYGHVPMREPVADYTVEWVTFGIPTGFDIGASIDLMAITTWFVDIDAIKGACNGVTISATYGGGLSVTLYWTGEWKGVDGTSHPIGIGLVSSLGIEFGAGVFYNASVTEFFNFRKK